MSHDELKGLVADLAIGALDEAEARRVEAHLAGCPECAAELRSLTGTAQLLRTLPPIPAPPTGEASLLDGARRAAARMAPPPAPARRVPRWLLGLALGGAGAAAALLVSLQLGRAPASRFDEGRGALEGSGAPATVAAAPAPAPSAAPPAPEPEEAKARRQEPAGGLGAAAPASPSAPSASGSLGSADTPAAPPVTAPPPAQPAPKRKAAPEAIGIRESPPAAAQAPARDTAAPVPAADAVAEAAATPERDAERYAAPGSANLAQSAAPAPAAAKAAAKLERPPDGAAAEDRARASSAVAEAAPSAATARLAKGQADQGPAAPPPEIRRAPGCAGETRRTLWRDAAGRVVGRQREGRLGGQAYRIHETFDASGRLATARLEAGGRTATADRAGVAEGRLAGLVPGLEVAVDAAAAEAAPPRCGP